MRHFRHKILLGAIPLVAVFSIVGTSIKDAKPQPHYATKLEANESTEIYRLNCYDVSEDGAQIDLFFNARPKAYRNVTKSIFDDISNSVVDIIKEIGEAQIDLGGSLVDEQQNQQQQGRKNYRIVNRAPEISAGQGGTIQDVSALFAAIFQAQFLDEDGNIDVGALNEYASGHNASYGDITTYMGYRDAIQTTGSTDEDTLRQIALEYSEAVVTSLGGEEAVNSATGRDDSVAYIADQIFDNYFEDKILDVDNYQPSLDNLGGAVSVLTEALDFQDEHTEEGEQILSVANLVVSLDQAAGDKQTVTQDVENACNDPELTGDVVVGVVTNNDPVVLGEFFANTIGDSTKTTTETSGADALKATLETLTGAQFADIASAIGTQGLKDLTSGIDGLSRADLAKIAIDSVTMKDIIKMIKTVIINDRTVILEKELQFDELKKLIRDLPKLKDIRNYSDDEMRHTFNVVLKTSLGDLKFDFTLGLFGNCDYIREIAAFIDDTIQFQVVDGVYCITIKSPEKLYKAYLRFLESEAFSDDLKHEIIDTVFSSFREIKQYVADKEIEDVIDNLKDIDYEVIAETVMSADEWNDILHQIFGSSRSITNEQIDEAIDRFFEMVEKASTKTYDDILSFVQNYFDVSALDNERIEKVVNRFFKLLKKVANQDIDHELFRSLADPDDDTWNNERVYGEYIDKLINYKSGYNRVKNLILRLFNKVPEQHLDKKIMDYYVGDEDGKGGKFVYNEQLTINVDSLLARAQAKLPEKAYNIAKKFIEKIPSTLKINANATFPHIHSITYDLSAYSEEERGLYKETKVIALPEGANVSFCGNIQELAGHPIAKWVDAQGNEVTTMPNNDIVVYPYIEYDLEIDDRTPEVWNGDGEIEAIVTPDGEGYQYQWYKVPDVGEPILLEGATDPILPVVNVADSGTYKVVVRVNGGVVLEQQITVSIEKAVVSYGAGDTALKWVGGDATYDGHEHDVHLENIPEYTVVKYREGTSGDFDLDEAPVKTDVGSYHTEAVLIPDDNHRLPDDSEFDFTKDWVISQKVIDLSELEWTFVDEYAQYSPAGHALPTLVVPDVEDIGQVSFAYTTTKNGEAYNKSKAYNVGEYVVSVEISVNNPNYSLVLPDEFPLTATLHVITHEIPTEAFAINEDTFTYDGEFHRPKLIKNPEYEGADYIAEHIVIVDYSENNDVRGEVEPGEYTLHVKLAIRSTLPADAYVLEETDLYFPYVINKAVKNPGLLSFDSSTVYYDGEEHSIVLTDIDGNQFEDEVFDITYKYDGEEATGKVDAGTYAVTAEIVLNDTEHYELADGVETEYEAQLTINPVPIPVTDFDYEVDQTVFTYDGEVHIPVLSGYPEGVEVASTVVTPNNASVNAGSYHVVYTLVSTDPNYVIPTGYETYHVNYEIKPIEVSVPTLTWNYYGAYTYTGSQFKVSLFTFLPEQAEAVYSGEVAATEIGQYTAVADIKLKSEYDNGNYVLVGETHSELSWEIKGVVATHFVSEQTEGDDPLGIADSTVALPADFSLSVEKKDIDLSGVDFSEWFGDKELEFIGSYEVKFLDVNGEEVDISEYDTHLTVKLYIPEQYRSADIKLFHVAEDGSVDLVESTQLDNYIEFETEHFSDYSLVKSKTPPTEPVGENSNVASLVFVGGGSAMAISAFSIILLLGKKKGLKK